MRKTYLISFVATLVIALLFVNNLNNNPKVSNTTDNTPSNLAVSVISIDDNNTNLASIFAAKSKVINWITNDSSKNTTVDINLLKKSSSDPIQYELIRKIVSNTNNDGQYIWNPNAGELDGGYYIEVTCGQNYTEGECVVSGNPLEVK